MTGKEKCRMLREIRGQIAEANGIGMSERECTHEGECSGTCAYCEQEVRELEQKLQKRASLGKKIALAGLCAGMVVATAGCSIIDEVARTAGIIPTVDVQLAGDLETAPPELPLTGEVAPTDFTTLGWVSPEDAP